MSVSLYELACRTNDCSRCGAKAGHSCVTSSGRLAEMPHHARTWPVFEAFSAGYQEATNDVLDTIIDGGQVLPGWLQTQLERRRRERGLDG